MTDRTFLIEQPERTCLTCKERPSGRYYHCKRCREDRDKVQCPEGCGNRKTRRAKRCKPCNGKLRGPEHPAWKGGKTKDSEGYVRAYAPGHPRANMDRYVLEHALVMEEHLGRYLTDGENVHHKNGKRDDNRLENLELWFSGQPAGQRVEDLVAWAHEILARYGRENAA